MYIVYNSKTKRRLNPNYDKGLVWYEALITNCASLSPSPYPLTSHYCSPKQTDTHTYIIYIHILTCT